MRHFPIHLFIFSSPKVVEYLDNGPGCRVVLQVFHLLDRPSDGMSIQCLSEARFDDDDILLIKTFHDTFPISGIRLHWLFLRHCRHRPARGRLPAGPAPTLYPRWQRSNHVQVCTPVCSLADGCFQYPWVDVTVVVHWWISGS